MAQRPESAAGRGSPRSNRHTGSVISLELARALRAAGVDWTPAPGDRFVVPDRDMDEDVFVLSDMAIDIHEYASGKVIGFNGTTEWALDSIEQHSVVWLPRETQLRNLLGQHFQRLERSADRYEVVAIVEGQPQGFGDADVESAYARALLAVLP